MSFDPTNDSHRRFNPLTGDSVIISPHRMKRPWQGQTESEQTAALLQYDPKCYLCPTNERSSGANNGPYKSTMVFENDFPALLKPPGPATPPPSHPLLRLEPIQGHCDVVIFHPRHDLTLALVSPEDISKVIQQWKDTYLKRGKENRINYIQIFENKGAMMGCSNPHPHGQVWSLSEVPQLPAAELSSLYKYALNTPLSNSGAPVGFEGRSCMLCEYAHFEVNGVPKSEGRVVILNEHWVALAPWWAVWPYELMVLPYRRHISSLLDMDDPETTSLAQILSAVAIRYDNLFRCSFPYSMGIHQRPTPRKTSEPDQDDVAHIHFHFDPPLLRSATVRKFLVGFELMSEPQRDLTPEQAAQKLRDCSEIHYTNTD